MLKKIRQVLSRRRRNATDTYEMERSRMLEHDLAARGITSERVVQAMARVPRESFVDEKSQPQAYADRALPIACEQTISQPYIVAWMTQLLEIEAGERVLEIGTGSGYQTAVLAELAAEVVTIERHEELSHTAQQTLADLGYSNITFIIGDGSLGWPAMAPYDCILITAAAEEVPPALVEQLAQSGRLVAPIGNRNAQKMHLLRKQHGEIQRQELAACRFVPLIGEQGFSETS